MKKFLTKNVLCGVTLLSLTACTSLNNKADKGRLVEGKNVSEITIFSPEQIKGIASISINDNFVATLPSQHQFSQKLCAGNYILDVRSVRSSSSELEKTATESSAEKATKKTVKKSRKKVKNQEVNVPLVNVKSNEISPILVTQKVNLLTDTTIYLKLSKDKNNNWSLAEVSQSEFAKFDNLTQTSKQFIRRLPDSMIKCK